MKRIFFTIVILFMSIFLLAGCGVPKEEYDKIERDLGLAQTELDRLTSELAQKNAEVNQLEREYKKVESDLQATGTELIQVTDELAQTESELDELEYEFNLLQNDYGELENRHRKLMVDYTSTLDEYTSALEELGQSLTVPYTTISGRQITCAWEDMHGEVQKWTWPIDIYRNWIEMPKPDITVSLECGDSIYTMHDFTLYVRSGIFREVIPSFYQQCVDEMAFAKEIFNLVTQLTVYSEDVGEIPRWPVETLTEAGGDCEDLAILFASLLKAAPYPYKVNLVYMDIDNPTDPLHPNHVIVFVETNDWKTFVECTSKQGWDYYERVVGWYYEL